MRERENTQALCKYGTQQLVLSLVPRFQVLGVHTLIQTLSILPLSHS